MKLKCLCCALLLLLIVSGCKKENIGNSLSPIKTITSTIFSVANVLQSNMVIQRDKPANIWGFATTGSIVTVKASWNSATITTKADGSGHWQVSIPASAANNIPQTIAINSGSNSIVLNNILIGDIWVCSGQSNMVYPVGPASPFEGVLNYQSEISAANYSQIRVLTLHSDAEQNPADSLNYCTTWNVCSPQTAGDISGVAYYFARKLNTSLSVPIGIIISAVDGTSCEAWINNAGFQSDTYLLKYAGSNSATMYYNGMINPLVNLSIKGFIWYQGENNKNNSPVSDYTQLNSTLIEAWRTVFNQGVLPFYFVQMTPFDQNYNLTNPPGGDLSDDSYAKFREAQAKVLAEPNTGMAITMDVGEVTNQHPPDKKPVGERLALLALNKTYGQNVQCYGPQYASWSASSQTVTINFNPGTAEGLNTINNAPLNQFFYVAGTNHVFLQANASISGNQVILTVPANTPLPVQAVRYAFTVAPVTNLQNSAALPIEPFRTDNWSN